jgi:glucosyl-3-phosphoglycerate synthase
MRIHRNQTTAALGKRSYGILNTFFARAEKYGLLKKYGETGGSHIALETYSNASGGHKVIKTAISAEERPPMLEIPEYVEKFRKGT